MSEECNDTVTVTVSAAWLGRLRALIAALDKFRVEQTNGGEGDPQCGWVEYDEIVTDYSREIAEIAEGLFEEKTNDV